MKTKLILIGTVLFSFASIAQNGINYKAVIKDDSGNIVANDLIVMEFEIENESAVLYRETHTPTTDDNGIVVLAIGEGTPILGDFSDIEWIADNHYLTVFVNTGAGLTNVGSSQFRPVPYASAADVAKTLESPIWKENGNGDGINYLDGKVGIGLENPINTFFILQPDASENAVRIQSLDHPSGRDLIELKIPAGSPAASQFTTFK